MPRTLANTRSGSGLTAASGAEASPASAAGASMDVAGAAVPDAAVELACVLPAAGSVLMARRSGCRTRNTPNTPTVPRARRAAVAGRTAHAADRARHFACKGRATHAWCGQRVAVADDAPRLTQALTLGASRMSGIHASVPACAGKHVHSEVSANHDARQTRGRSIAANHQHSPPTRLNAALARHHGQKCALRPLLRLSHCAHGRMTTGCRLAWLRHRRRQTPPRKRAPDAMGGCQCHAAAPGAPVLRVLRRHDSCTHVARLPRLLDRGS